MARLIRMPCCTRQVVPVLHMLAPVAGCLPRDAPPLPATDKRDAIVRVSNASQLADAWRDLTRNQAIVVATAAGDLHLAANVSISRVTSLLDAVDDFDAQLRPSGANAADVCADQSLPDRILRDGFGG